MSSKKQGAAKKAAPKEVRKKPGPAARAKARQQAANYPAVGVVPEAPPSIVSSLKARNDALAAQARLDNARAAELELQNSERRQKMLRDGCVVEEGSSVSGRVSGAARTGPAFTFAGDCADEPRGANEAKAPAPVMDFRREMGDLRDSLSSLESITDALAKRLDPVLRAPEPTLAAGDVGEDGRNRSPVAQEVYDQRHRVDMVFLLVSRIHDRLDLPY